MDRTIIKSQRNWIICTSLLCIYAVITFIGAINHEIWLDEAQAWNIARDNDIYGIIRAMQYEGHPPLWYFILFIFSHLGFSCKIMPLISWFFSVITAMLILYKMPFSIAVKVSVVFSGGFLFVNSVISRVYCLIPLLLCLIAIVYPKRKKYPIWYGLLIGLLADTHVVMCGVVGALGIFMLIDLYKDWKNNTVNQNIRNLVGLIIAASGVFLLIAPLLGSISLNRDVSNRQGNIGVYLNRLVAAPYNIGVAATNHQNCMGWISALTTPILWLCYIAVLLLIRRHHRALVTELMFSLFYMLVSEMIWYTIPNRALIFIFSIVFSVWMAHGENNADKEEKKLPNASSPLMAKLFSFAAAADKKTISSCCLLVVVVNVITTPMGMYYLFNDYVKQFSAAEKTSLYIRENLSEDALYVYAEDGIPELSAYLPGYDFYSIMTRECSTYRSFHKTFPDAVYSEISGDISKYNEVYLIEINKNPEADINTEVVLFICDEGMPYINNGTLSYIEISKFSERGLNEMINRYNAKNA